MERYNYSGTEYDPDTTYSHDKGQASAENRNAPRNTGRQQRQASVKGNNSSHSHKNDTNNSFITKAIKFLTNKRTKAIAGIALILLAGYLLICGISFLRTGKVDQSAIKETTISELVVDQSANIENIGGPVGAKVSNHLFVEGLGLGSIVLLVYMFLVGLSLLNIKKCHFWSMTFKALLLAITISMVLGFFTMNSHTAAPLGGYHGRYINQLLQASIGSIGALFINILLIAAVVTLYINDLTAAYRKYKTKIRTLRDRKIRLIDEKEFIEQKVNNAMSGTPLQQAEENDYAQSETETNTNPGTTIPLTHTPEIDHFGSNPVDNSTDVSDIPDNKQTNDNNLGKKGNLSTPETEFQVSQAEQIEQADSLPDEIKAQGPYDPKADLSRFKLPTIELLKERPVKSNSVDLTEQQENKERIIKTLRDYGVEISHIEATVGPTITLYEIIPAEGIRINRITRLADDIALNLAALGIRIIAPIPGKGTIGIEVPNKDPQIVSLRSILGSKAYRDTKYALPLAMGATISNEVYITDLTKMPHLLVAGATGQGKSVGLNTIIASLIFKKHPAELKFVLIDPKMVEFSLYARLEKHYLAKLPNEADPIITEPSKAVDTLNSLCIEMDQRYSLLKQAECRSIKEYNAAFVERRLNPEKGHRYLPYIVMIVDEFADLMMSAGKSKSIETPIARIAQKARAVGMHMIIATQRPSINVITGIIKANFPGRIGFRVTQMIDSRTILDAPGANQLVGNGDMLIIASNGAMQRVQCALIDTDEVNAICHYIDNQVGYPHAYILPEPPAEGSEISSTTFNGERDSLFDEVARWIVQGNNASTSQIQRRYAIGYNRAGKIMDQMELAGIVGSNNGGKPRDVKVSPSELEMILSTYKS